MKEAKEWEKREEKRKEKRKDNAEAQSALRFAEKRDSNTPTGSGQAPVTEGRTQKAQRG